MHHQALSAWGTDRFNGALQPAESSLSLPPPSFLLPPPSFLLPPPSSLLPSLRSRKGGPNAPKAVSYTHLRAHETEADL
eukprot:3250801-Rhodomonas_salina.2